MDIDELHQRGLALRRQLFGDEAVARRMEAMGAFGEPLQRMVNAYSYGDLWQRPQLDLRSRSLAMIGITAALGRPTELKVHVSGALRNGTTADEIREVLLLVALYAGLPAGIDAHKAALEAIEAHQAQVQPPTTGPRGAQR